MSIKWCLFKEVTFCQERSCSECYIYQALKTGDEPVMGGRIVLAEEDKRLETHRSVSLRLGQAIEQSKIHSTILNGFS